MKNDTTDKKVDNNLSESELINVTGGISSCNRHKNQEECESNIGCKWYSKSNRCELVNEWL